MIFSGVRLIFISLMNTKSGIFTRGFATHENTAFGVHSVKYKSILHRKNQISSIYDHCWSCIMWIIIKDSLPIWWIQGILVISTFCTQGLVYPCPLVCIIFFFIQFTVPFKIISLIEVSQSIGGVKRKYPGKTT